MIDTIDGQFAELETVDFNKGLLQSQWKVTHSFHPFVFWGSPIPDKRVRVVLQVIQRDPLKASVVVERQELNKGLYWGGLTRWEKKKMMRISRML